MLLAEASGVGRRQEMASKSEKELRREIAYLTNLIDGHKKKTAKTSNKRRPAVEANKFKWTATTSRPPIAVETSPVISKVIRTKNEQSVPLHSTSTLTHSRPFSSTSTSSSSAPTHNLSTTVAIPNHPRVKHHHGNQARRVRFHGNKKWGNMVYTPSSVTPVTKEDTQTSPGHNRRSITRTRPGVLPSSSSPSSSTTSSSISHTVTRLSPSSLEHRRRMSTISRSTVPLRIPSSYKWSQRTTSSTKPSPSTNSSLLSQRPTASPVKPATVLPAASANYTSHSHSKLVSTPRSSRYRWRRRSSSSSSSGLAGGRKIHKMKSPISKSPLTPSVHSVSLLRQHTPSWVIHNRFKLTHTSIINKYSKIMQRQKHNKTVKISRLRNKVWKSTEISKPLSRTNVTVTPSPVRKLSGGRERKTRQGNRQWRPTSRTPLYSGQKPGATPRSSGQRSGGIPRRRLSGHEMKTRHGNRQWVARRVARERRNRIIINPAKNFSLKNRRGSRYLARREGGGGGKSLQMVKLSGQRFVIDSGGRRMKRLSLSSPSRHLSFSSFSSSMRQRTRSRTRSVTDASFTSSSVKQYLAGRAVQRSKRFVWTAKQKKRKEKKKNYCIFYNRFGKCNRGKECPFTHDPGKIAICSKFLRGMCDKVDGSCLFSHTLSKDKMPTCVYFLRGECTREVCPYRHVTVGEDAGICLDFARGHCPNGTQCPKQHVVNCPEFTKTGSCPRGTKCLLRHKRKKKVESSSRRVVEHAVTPPTKTPVAFRILRHRQRKVLHEVVDDTTSSEAGEEDGREGGEGGEGGDELFDNRRLSPLDPHCPAPEFLSL